MTVLRLIFTATAMKAAYRNLAVWQKEEEVK